MLLLLGHGFVRTTVRTAVIESSSTPSAQVHGDMQQHYGRKAFMTRWKKIFSFYFLFSRFIFYELRKNSR